MSGTALPTDGRFRFVASDRTGRPWITLIALRGVHESGTGSHSPMDPSYCEAGGSRRNSASVKHRNMYEKFATCKACSIVSPSRCQALR